MRLAVTDTVGGTDGDDTGEVLDVPERELADAVVVAVAVSVGTLVGLPAGTAVAVALKEAGAVVVLGADVQPSVPDADTLTPDISDMEA